jgi:molecular chaperone IbpA
VASGRAGFDIGRRIADSRIAATRVGFDRRLLKRLSTAPTSMAPEARAASANSWIHVALQEDVAMRTLDFSPLFRSTVGFDHMMRLLDEAARYDQASDGYPPYNIEAVGEDAYRITVAVAGFRPDELSIIDHQGMLTVAGRKAGEDNAHYLHRGIAGLAFERHFSLAEHVKVTGASLADGLLRIELVREVPEAMRPRRIEIAAGPAPTAIEGKRKPAGEKRAA